MKKLFVFTLLLVLGFISCKTEFEKVRTSNDPFVIFEKASGYYSEGDYYKAQTLYEIVIPFYRGKEQAQDLFFKYAYCHYNQEQFILASSYFENFASTFYNSPNKEEAEYMAAYAQYKLSPNYRLDQTNTLSAITAFQRFINTNPDSERNVECTRLIDEMRAKMEVKAFEQGKLYYEIKNYKAAISSMENMIKDYPETKRSEEIKWIILDSNYTLAINSVFEKQEERFAETLKKATRFKNKYTNSKYIEQVLKIENNCITSIKEIQNVGLEN
jgi:outer membrane protein assembly factor BamD